MRVLERMQGILERTYDLENAHRVTEFPLTPSGKIQKFVLLDQWKAGQFDA